MSSSLNGIRIDFYERVRSIGASVQSGTARCGSACCTAGSWIVKQIKKIALAIFAVISWPFHKAMSLCQRCRAPAPIASIEVRSDTLIDQRHREEDQTKIDALTQEVVANRLKIKALTAVNSASEVANKELQSRLQNALKDAQQVPVLNDELVKIKKELSHMTGVAAELEDRLSAHITSSTNRKQNSKHKG